MRKLLILADKYMPTLEEGAMNGPSRFTGQLYRYMRTRQEELGIQTTLLTSEDSTIEGDVYRWDDNSVHYGGERIARHQRDLLKDFIFGNAHFDVGVMGDSSRTVIPEMAQLCDRVVVFAHSPLYSRFVFTGYSSLLAMKDRFKSVVVVSPSQYAKASTYRSFGDDLIDGVIPPAIYDHDLWPTVCDHTGSFVLNSRPTREREVEFVVRAFQLRPHYNLIIYGPLFDHAQEHIWFRNEFEPLLNETPNVHWAGHLYDADLYEHLKLGVASLANCREDAFSLASFEAHCLGLPLMVIHRAKRNGVFDYAKKDGSVPVETYRVKKADIPKLIADALDQLMDISTIEKRQAIQDYMISSFPPESVISQIMGDE